MFDPTAGRFLADHRRGLVILMLHLILTACNVQVQALEAARAAGAARRPPAEGAEAEAAAGGGATVPPPETLEVAGLGVRFGGSRP